MLGAGLLGVPKDEVLLRALFSSDYVVSSGFFLQFTEILDKPNKVFCGHSELLRHPLIILVRMASSSRLVLLSGKFGCLSFPWSY